MPDMEPFDFGGPIVWRPSPEQVAGTRLQQFMDRHGLASLADLQRRSTTDLEWFWRAVLEDLGIEFYEPYSRLVDISRGIPWTSWCVGARLNIAHNCVDKWVGTPVEQRTAVRWEGEEGATRELTYGDLSRKVNRACHALRRLGARKGDVIGLFMPMCPEIVVALLASARIGAIVLPLFSGYGADATATRLADADARFLVTADGFLRRGRPVAMKPIADAAAAGVPSMRHVLVVRRLGEGIDVPWSSGRDRWWHEELAPAAEISEPERTSAEDPVMIIYTSGTTGRPKGAVHTHCGFPIKAAQDMAHLFDVRGDDVMYWVTDMGWMMGPWEVFGATLLSATMVIYDGAPDHPGPDRLWELVERHGVSILGVSPTLVRSLLRHGRDPVARHDLASLRMFGSTGEPWNPEPWRWLFEEVGQRRRPIINYSGGTEVSGGLVGGNLLSPMKPCAFAGPVPGIAADVVDDQGQPVRGAVGELVVRQPWIGMTRGFWKDPDRYLATYWSRFPDTWVHGDWAAIDEDGLWYILGRSDDTIKVAGKRLGPAEVESVLVEHPAVLEAAAIGVPDEMKGQAVVCFCVLRPGHEPGDTLAQALASLVAERLGKPLRPKTVEFVGDLPKTRNAKVMRRVIRAAWLNADPGDLSSLENPQAVEEIRRVASGSD
jgi:acetyl-CoA synthetase